jgi:hypothetical protein
MNNITVDTSIEQLSFLGPLLRWIRAGTTRRGNPLAAVVFTFLLVQVVQLLVYHRSISLISLNI